MNARRYGFLIVIGLAILQAALAVLRSYELFQIGADLTKRGAIFVPLMGLITLASAGTVIAMALLYCLFAYGALQGKGWARAVAFVAIALNVVLVASALMNGAPAAAALLWTIIPAVVLLYLLTVPVARAPA
jgi:hypothetical protein